MKNLLYVYVALGIWALSSCASATDTTTTTITTQTVTVLGPTGIWDYTIKGTPEGDFAGLLTIAEAGALFTATIAVNGNALPIENFVFHTETKKLTGELNYSGLVIAFDALMTGDELNGAMAEGGVEFPFKAIRKK